MLGFLRDCFLTSFLDTDATDFTDFHGIIFKNMSFSVCSVKSVYKKNKVLDLRNTLSGLFE